MRRLIALSGLVLLGILSCLVISFVLAIPVPGLAGPGDEPESAEEAARRVTCGLGAPLDFQVRSRIPRPGGVVILYDVRCPPGAGREATPRLAGATVVQDLVSQTVNIGDRVVWEDRFWSADPGLPVDVPPFAEGLPPAARGPFISYEGRGGSGWSEGIGNYDFVSGRVLAPTKVFVVEAVLDNGDTVRGDVTRGVWVLFALESRIREVRALDRDSRVVQRIDMTSDT